jgi:hypothetical protein
MPANTPVGLGRQSPSQTKASLAIAQVVAGRNPPNISPTGAEKGRRRKDTGPPITTGERLTSRASEPKNSIAASARSTKVAKSSNDRGATTKKATHAFLNHVNQSTFKEYHEAVNRPGWEVIADYKSQFNSLRCTLFQLLAVVWLILAILRPYLLLMSPLVVAHALANPKANGFVTLYEDLGGWSVPSLAAAWFLVLAWHCYAEFVPKRSPRTDGRVGDGPHGTVTQHAYSRYVIALTY